jgi:hypothetical protein
MKKNKGLPKEIFYKKMFNPKRVTKLADLTVLITPVPTCNESTCTVQLHKTQGILDKNHPTPLAQYREGIAMGLMVRMTEPLDNLHNIYRTCKLCPNLCLERGQHTLNHVALHGGELGHIVHTSSIIEALKKFELNDGKEESVCTLCFMSFATPMANYLHRVRDYSEETGRDI